MCTKIVTDGTVACSEPDTRIDPSRFFNLTANGNTRVVKTAGGRAGNSVNELNAIDRAESIGMIVVLQHSGKRELNQCWTMAAVYLGLGS